jgi:hypothetical protein
VPAMEYFLYVGATDLVSFILFLERLIKFYEEKKFKCEKRVVNKYLYKNYYR